MIARRVAVIGLDAADFEFLDPWRAAGDLPVLDGILKQGASGPLASTVPPVSAAAWATFMTGLNPGAHGLYDFVMEDPRTDRPVLARADLIRGAKMWDLLSAAGRRSVVVNLPITWPPSPFNGVMVTGMLTPEGQATFTHPPELGAEILRRFPGYRCDVDVALKEDPPALRVHLDHLAEQGAGLMRHLMASEKWDLFVGIFTTTDRMQHLFWPERETAIREHYRKVDRWVGEILSGLGPEDLVLLLSDHGFHGVRVKFYVNRWLEEQGWLRTRPREPDGAPPPDSTDLERGEKFFAWPRRRRGLLSRILGGGAGEEEDLEVDRAGSRAWLYSVWTGGVRINLEGRSPQGTVAPGPEYEGLRDEIIAGLRALRFPGEDVPLFDWVGRAEEVYRGAMLEWGPDIVTRSNGFRVEPGKNLGEGRVLRVSKHDRGTHSDTGIFAVRGPGVRGGARIEGAGIQDVLPTVLWSLGLEIPPGLDGRVLEEAFTDEARRGSPIRIAAAAAGGASAAAGSAPAAAAPAMTEGEEEELRRTLEGLGYI